MTLKKISFPGWLKLTLKLLVTVVCVWYLVGKIDFKATSLLMHQSHMSEVIAAAFFFVLSKWVSAIRLQFYFKTIGVSISNNENLKLYWLGMFYNLFLPGGIGGDAYKVILLHRVKGYEPKSLTAAVFLDRVSGVAALGILSGICFFILFLPQKIAYYGVASAGVGLVVFYLLVRNVFPTFLPCFFNTFWIGLLVQCLQICSVLAIMNSLGIQNNHTEYILLFLLSSVVAVLPFTIGGLGAREIVFLWGSNYFNLSKESSVSISLFFYLITVIVSIPGIWWVFINPLIKNQVKLNKK